MERVATQLDSQPLQFGRLDVKAESLDALLRGHFVVIDLNGCNAGSFDPGHQLCWHQAAWKIAVQTVERGDALPLPEFLHVAHTAVLRSLACNNSETGYAPNALR